MTPAFLTAWAATGRDEGGYSYDARDSGGETNHGITKRVALANGFEGDMRDLTQEQAREIAKVQYWDVLRLDAVAALSLPIARELFDSGFLCGHATAAKWLQRLLNVATKGTPLRVDGLVGPLTVYTLKEYLGRRGKEGERVMLNGLNAFQSVHHTELAEAREKDEAFWFGWQSKRVRIV